MEKESTSFGSHLLIRLAEIFTLESGKNTTNKRILISEQKSSQR